MKFDVQKEFVFNENPQAPSCHASTVALTKDGNVCCAWFGGAEEGKTDVDIWTSVRTKKGWSAPSRISADADLPHWNPVLYHRPDGMLCLFFKVGMKIAYWKTYFSLSQDGLSWSTPSELVPGDTSGGRGPVKNKLLQMRDGRLLAPASSEQNSDWRVFIDISDNGGDTWRRTEFIDRPERYGKAVRMIQPTLWEDSDGAVHALMRTNSGFVFRSDSFDRGESWCKAYKTPLYNNNSGIDVARLPDGRLFLISNPVRTNWGERSPLTVAMSVNNGGSWDMGVVLESEKGEFSYPAIVAAGENELIISYTWKRKRIAFAKIKV